MPSNKEDIDWIETIHITQKDDDDNHSLLKQSSVVIGIVFFLCTQQNQVVP